MDQNFKTSKKKKELEKSLRAWQNQDNGGFGRKFSRWGDDHGRMKTKERSLKGVGTSGKTLATCLAC